MEFCMAESGNGVSKLTLLISIGAALLIGFLSGIIYSDRPPQTGGQSAQGPLPQLPPLQAPQQNLDQTISSLLLAAQQNPNNADIWTQLGNAYFDSDQPAKSIEAYNKSLAIIPSNPPVLTDLGVMYRRDGKPDLALESFNKALQVSPGFEQALFNKGVVLYNDLGDLNGALQAWRELLLVNPGARGPNGVAISEMVDNLAKQAGTQ